MQSCPREQPGVLFRSLTFAFISLTVKEKSEREIYIFRSVIESIGSSPGPPRHMHGSWHMAHSTWLSLGMVPWAM